MRALLTSLAVLTALAMAPIPTADARPTAARQVPAREHSMKSLGNWRQIFRVLRPKNTRTLARARNVTDVDIDQLDARRAALGKPRLTAVLLDVDETIASHHGGIGREEMAHIRALLDRGLVVGIYSNGAEDMNPRRTADLAALRAMGVWVAGADLEAKPDVAGFRGALAGLARHAADRGRPFDPTRVAMIGDNLMTDGGAIQAGIDFVKIAPVPTDERPFMSPVPLLIKRTTQRVLRAYGAAVSTIHDAGRAVLRRPTALVLPAPAAE